MLSCRLLVCAALLLSASSARADEWRVDDGPVFVHLSPVDSRADALGTARVAEAGIGTGAVRVSIAKLVPVGAFGSGVYLNSGLELGTRYGTYIPGVAVGVLGRGALREQLDVVLRAGIDAPFDPRSREPVDPDGPQRMYDPIPQSLELSATLVGERVGPGFRAGLAADLPLARWGDWPAEQPRVHLELGGGGRKGDVAFAAELDLSDTIGADTGLSVGAYVSLEYHTPWVIPYVTVGAPFLGDGNTFTGLGVGVCVPL
jgi:hypothetical protein